MPHLAVLGQPVAHSRSPAMHSAAFAELGMKDWSYEAIGVSPSGFEALVRELSGRGFAGVNVTVPHKLAALALADRASPAATGIGAANTLSFSGGLIAADNTDAAGLLAALGRSPRGSAALVLGAGGSARAAVWALSDAGAEVSVFNRTRARAESLASELGARLVDPPSGEGPLDVEPYGLIVNATSVGLESANSPAREAVIAERLARADLKALRIDADALSEGQTVVDLVYGKRETALVSAARRRRARVVEGIEVLVGQGAESFRIWTALEPPVSSMRSAALSGAQVL